MGNNCQTCDRENAQQQPPIQNITDPTNPLIKLRTQIYQIPTPPNNIQQKISKLAKISLKSQVDNPNVKPRKIWKVRPPYSFIYRNQQSDENGLPNGLCTLVKYKENDDFGGFFQGYIEKGVLKTENSVIVYANGSQFIGGAKNKGTYNNDKTNLFYEGEWMKQMPQGFGIETTNKGRYEGNFVNGKKNGHGEYTFADGSKYVGSFGSEGVVGKGIYSDTTNNYVYEGEYLNNQKQGYGIWKSEKSGIEYYGYFKAGQRSGNGRLILKNLGVYEGEFKNDLPHGYGQFKNNDGSVFKGCWEKGQLISIY